MATIELSPTTVAAAGGPPAAAPIHLKWLIDTGERLKTADGMVIEVWELRHEKDENILSAWAKHFRSHYCSEANIDFLRGPLSARNIWKRSNCRRERRNWGPAFELGTLPRSSFPISYSGFWVIPFRAFGGIPKSSEMNPPKEVMLSGSTLKTKRSRRRKTRWPSLRGL